MSKITLELDLDLFDDEGNLSEAFETRISDALIRLIDKRFGEDISKRVADRAERFIAAKTELVINSVLEQPITVPNGWSKSTTYDSILDMVEQKMTDLYQGKIGDSGKCEKDPLLIKIEQNTKATADRILSKIESLATAKSQEAARKAVASHNLIKALGAVVYTDNSVKLKDTDPN